MNEPDDFNLHDQLADAIGEEPPMRSDALGDVRRGRGKARRRRVGAVIITAATVPALMIAGWALAGPSGSGSVGDRADRVPARRRRRHAHRAGAERR